MERFRINEIIANKNNPYEKGFLCGNIRGIDEEGYIIWYPGDIIVRIRESDAVLLRDVLDEYIDTDLIIADRQYIRKNLFIGGRRSRSALGSLDQAHSCIELIDGKSFYILHDDEISAIEALRKIETCPRTQNR
ncbi:MAG: hypothetical protein CR972_03265 [Candidatus Moraniibacteriota bacterium]|nr:MAG: hypothetical protein CR972_03265 [Candidatus Moranbacteria bacterium]